jgi:hypothetical protein
MLDSTKEIISMGESYINHVKNHCDGTGSRDQNREQMYEASPSGERETWSNCRRTQERIRVMRACFTS